MQNQEETHIENKSDTPLNPAAIGKRMTFYLDNEAVNCLESFINETGMKSSHTVSGLLRMLSNTEEKAEYGPLYRKVKMFFARGNTEFAIRHVNTNLPPCFIDVKNQKLETLRDKSVFKKTPNNEIGVLVATDPAVGIEFWLANAVNLKNTYLLKELIVVIVHDADQMDPSYVNTVALMKIHLIPTSEIRKIIDSKMLEYKIDSDPYRICVERE